MSKRTLHWTPTAIVACLGFWWSWTAAPIFIKLLADSLDAWTQNAARYAVAFLFWLPYLIFYLSRYNHPPGLWRRAIIPSLFNIGMQTCWTASLYYQPPAFSLLLSRTSILWVSLLSLILFADERPMMRRKRFWVGVVLALTGLAGVLLKNPTLDQPTTLVGVGLALATSITWTGYMVAVKILLNDIDSRLSFSVITIYTLAGLSALAAWRGKPAQLISLSAIDWVNVVVSAILAIALAHVFFYMAIKRIGAAIPSIITLLTPFSLLAISSVIFKERMTWQQLVFAAILIVGIVIAIWPKKIIDKIDKI